MPHPFHDLLRERTAELDRLVAFSDGVFAVAITILALQFDIPAHLQSESEFLKLFREELASIPIFLLSFAIIGLYWILHHRLFNFIERQDQGLVWLNLAFLAAVCFLPFPTKVFGDYSGGHWLATDGGAVATRAWILYASTVWISSTAISLMWWYASHRHRLIDPQLDPRLVRYFRLRGFVIPTVFGASIAVAFWDPSLAMHCWVLIPIAFFALQRAVSRQIRLEAEGET